MLWVRYAERAPDVSRLHVLVDGCERDLSVRASLVIEGTARRLPPDASLALYRGAEEALTNVSRHAPGAIATVALSYHSDPQPSASRTRHRHLPRRVPDFAASVADMVWPDCRNESNESAAPWMPVRAATGGA
ncbi:MAG: hypothetical protein QOI06_2288 [Nocardioidaceae bacterium]|nr:hypothetical protein [Nocardioidaceae bacterium]